MDRPTARLIQTNAKSTGLSVEVRAAKAEAVAAEPGDAFDFIFLDPPYQKDFLTQALPLCAQLLKPGGLVYAESGDRLPFPENAGAEDTVPEWLAQWELVRGDKAGMVHFHLLKLH